MNNGNNVKRTLLALSLSVISGVSNAKLVYISGSTSALDNPQNYPLSIQMASFAKEASAQHLLRQIRAHHSEHVAIKPNGNNYSVIVGPFSKKADALAFYQSFHQVDQIPISKAPEPINAPTPQPEQPLIPAKVFSQDNAFFNTNRGKWYINADVGGQYPTLSGSTSVNNGSGLSNPYDQDIYTFESNGGSVLLDVGLGKQFDLQHDYLQALSLGFQYQYFFSNNINGEVMQFSLPEFYNYNYNYPIASHLLLASLKLNFSPLYQISPFFKLGLGGSILSTDGYEETATAGVTPRISPNYSGSSSKNFAYTLGIGVDYPLGQQFLVSAAYQFSDLGSVQSGNGQGSWSAESLNFGRFQSNAFLFGATYLFDGKHA